MNLYLKGLFICLMAMSLLSVSGSFAYFSDEEESKDNVFTAGIWMDDEGCLEIDTNKTALTGKGDETKIHGTRIRNICDHEITIVEIWCSWESPTNVSKVNILGNQWEGSSFSNGTLYPINYVVLPGKPWQHVNFYFEGVTSPPLVLGFIMSDGSEKWKTWP